MPQSVSEIHRTLMIDYRCQTQYDALSHKQRFGILLLVGRDSRRVCKSQEQARWVELGMYTRIDIMFYAAKYYGAVSGDEISALLPHLYE